MNVQITKSGPPRSTLYRAEACGLVGTGRNVTEAVGDLVMQNPAVFGLTLTEVTQPELSVVRTADLPFCEQGLYEGYGPYSLRSELID